ncbi:MAG: septum formation family protein [Actinomycetaceae bacterium]|nr:septum formation family protein [Actinomycetaceae bacterium]
MRLKRYAAIFVGICVTCMSLSACSDSALSLRVGQCFTASDEVLLLREEITDVAPVPCTKEHNSEVVGVKVLAGGKYPGRDVLAEKTTDFCTKTFRTYVGIDFQDSQYDMYPLTPSEHSWNKAHDRLVSCIALSIPPHSKSIKNAKE